MSVHTDWLQAIGSILQALCALVIGFAACVIARKSNELALSAATTAHSLAAAQIRPMLVIHVFLSPKAISVTLSNQGAGPAILVKAQYCLIDRASGAERIVEDTGQYAPGTFYGLLDLSTLLPRNIPLEDVVDRTGTQVNMEIATSTIAAGEEVVLLTCQVQETEAGRQYMNSLRWALHGARIDIWYTDVRDGPVGAAGHAARAEQHVQKRLSML